jgi:hypothetical protein
VGEINVRDAAPGDGAGIARLTVKSGRVVLQRLAFGSPPGSSSNALGDEGQNHEEKEDNAEGCHDRDHEHDESPARHHSILGDPSKSSP